MLFFFFFNDTATTEIYTLSYTTLFRSLAHDRVVSLREAAHEVVAMGDARRVLDLPAGGVRSEEHTSELQSHSDLVCRLLLEKKKKNKKKEKKKKKDAYKKRITVTKMKE